MDELVIALLADKYFPREYPILGGLHDIAESLAKAVLRILPHGYSLNCRIIGVLDLTVTVGWLGTEPCCGGGDIDG